MFLKTKTLKSTGNSLGKIEHLKQKIEHADAIFIQESDSINIFRILLRNMALRICIPVDFIRSKHSKNIGHIGAGIFTLIDIWTLRNQFIRDYTN